jgi:hypothetical protein
MSYNRSDNRSGLPETANLKIIQVNRNLRPPPPLHPHHRNRYPLCLPLEDGPDSSNVVADSDPGWVTLIVICHLQEVVSMLWCVSTLDQLVIVLL